MNLRLIVTIAASLLAPLASYAQDELSPSTSMVWQRTSDLAVSSSGFHLWTAGNGQIFRFITRIGSSDYSHYSTGKIGAIALSNSNETLVVGLNGRTDGVLEFYNAIKPGEPTRMIRHDPDFRTIRFSPDNKYLAVLTEAGVADVIDLTTGKRVLMEPSAFVISDIQFDPTGKYLVATCGAFADRQMVTPGEIVVMDATTGKRVAYKMLENGTGFTGVSRSLQVATATFDGILIHTVTTTPEVAITQTKLIEAPLKAAYPFAISSLDYVVAGNKLFQISTGKEINLIDAEEMVSYVFSPDDKWLAGAKMKTPSGFKIWTLPKAEAAE